MQKTLTIFAFLAITALASIPINQEEIKSLWSSWKIYNGKSYTLAEEVARLAIFEENYKKVIQFNAANEDVKFAMNKFADLTSTEFKTLYASGYQPKSDLPVYESADSVEVGDLPASVDWRSKGAVSKVKNQGQCGSCWTFATTGVLESFYFINHGTLLSFSEQQIVDCDKNSDGCSGGDPIEALSYTAEYGLELEATYPYNAADNSCKYKKALALTTNGGSKLVTAKDTVALKTALVSQPVSVAIEADEDVFQLYSSGVIKSGCGASLDHAVLTVGYVTVSGDEAFIVKNSWGASWGQEGYVYLSTDQTLNSGSGACGILSQPVVPTK